MSRRWSIASRIFIALLLVVVVLSGCLTLLLWVVLRQSADDTAARLSLGVSTTLAHDPFVIAGVQNAEPSTVLGPYARRVVQTAGVDFVTIMDTTGTRFTHPDPRQIGKKFLGTTTEALQGRSLTETFVGTLGPSVRAVVPVMQGTKVIAIVSAGVTVDRVAESVTSRIPFIVAAAAVLVLVGTAGALAARRFLTRLTGSLRPAELSRMVGHHESVLHSMREGLILTDDRRRVVLYNDAAAELLHIRPAARDFEPVAVAGLELPPTLTALIESGCRAVEQSHLAAGRVLLVNQEPALVAGAPSGFGTLTTLRDRTEVQQLSGELESVRTLSTALRSQTHEYANRLHTVVSLLELGRASQAIAFLTEQSAQSQLLADELVGLAAEPMVAALLLGKAAQAEERGVTLRLTVGQALVGSTLSSTELVSVVGNLLDNAVDAAAAAAAGEGDAAPAAVPVAAAAAAGDWAEPLVTLRLHRDPLGRRIELEVSDSGAGVAPELVGHIFSRGFSTKPAGVTGRGYGLAIVREILREHGGDVSLQHSGPLGSTFLAHWQVVAGVDQFGDTEGNSARPVGRGASL